jgi:hypothetical protein
VTVHLAQDRAHGGGIALHDGGGDRNGLVEGGLRGGQERISSWLPWLGEVMLNEDSCTGMANDTRMPPPGLNEGKGRR